MKHSLIGLCMLTLMVGCSTAPRFQKATDLNGGYAAQDLDGKDHFKLEVPAKIVGDEMLERNYALRAIGEECAKRGYFNYDGGKIGVGTFEGYCFPQSSRKSLPASFQHSAIESKPARFVVESMGSRASTLEEGDEILEIEGKKPTTLTELKSIVFLTARKKNSVELKVKRNSKQIELKEPLVDFTNSTYGIADLEELRGRVR